MNGYPFEYLIPPEGATYEERMAAPLTLEVGGIGHPHEYLVNVGEFRDGGKDIPEHLVKPLINLLGEGWGVSNRGTRIEIYMPETGPNHEHVMASVESWGYQCLSSEQDEAHETPAPTNKSRRFLGIRWPSRQKA